MRKAICITFPRSGHHLLLRGLFTILPEHLVYSEGYKSQHNIKNCECVNFQKEHDLDLDHEIDEQYGYIIQSRNPTDAIRSWYRQAVQYEELETPWEEFEKQKREYHQKWINKWIMGRPKDSLVLTYGELTDNKQAAVMRVANYLLKDTCTSYADKMPELTRWAIGENFYNKP